MPAPQSAVTKMPAPQSAGILQINIECRFLQDAKSHLYKALCLLRHGSLPYRHTVCFAVSCLQTFFNACTAKCSHKNACTAKCGHFANKYRMSLFARCQKHTKHASQSSSKSKLLRIYINRRYQNECVIKR